MKKICSLVLCTICVFCLYLSVIGAEVLYYNFENDSFTTVTNNLKDGGTAAFEEGFDSNSLALNGSYGVKLGYVGNTFTVSAMVKISSTGGTNTIFFKDMDGAGNKWTGILSNGFKPAFWTHGTNHRWETVATGEPSLNQWSHVAYVENNAVGSLYVNGELVGTGNVENGAGDLYLGVTYWTADAVSGLIDEVKLYNNALSEADIMAMYESYIDFENAITLPEEVISDIELPVKIASKTVTWDSSDSSVISTTGKVTRQTEDKTVVLKALIDGEVISEFEVTVLKKPVVVNNKVILDYKFDHADGEIIHDKSGNGNHGAAFGNIVIGENGAVFDGVDDYVKMPEGVLNGHDTITIVATFKPSAAQKHVFLYGFGNTAETGYMFLNPSRPDTNLIRFAATETNAANESEIVSLPGVRNGEEVTVCVTVNDEYGAMYINGDLVADGDLGITVSDLGITAQNYIAKSLYNADPLFTGEMSRFTVYGYAMRESEVKETYGKTPEYAEISDNEEYITSVVFGEKITVEIDPDGRDDVKIAALVLDENNEVIEFSVTDSQELSVTAEGTIIVFAFDEENNVPGSIYVKGKGEGFSYEYTPGKVSVISEKDYKNGMVIVAGYDVAGTLIGVSFKMCDMAANEKVEIDGDFENAVDFKMMYWENLVAMAPVQ